MKRVFDENTVDYMYRYLLKYVGKYRVEAEIIDDFPRNKEGEIEESFDDLFIPCTYGVIKHTYAGNDILCVCMYDRQSMGIKIEKRIKEAFPQIEIECEAACNDYYIYFNANDIEKIATIIKPRTKGKNIDPFDMAVKEIKKKIITKTKNNYEIPVKDQNALYSITRSMTDRSAKMKFFKTYSSRYIEKIGREVDFNKSPLKIKQFIHSIGEWNNYVDFIQKSFDTL